MPPSTRSATSDNLEPEHVLQTFLTSVIERFSLTVRGQTLDYQSYLSLPDRDRTNDEANAVDQQFARYALEWLGFEPVNWDYNSTVAGHKADKPDYKVKVTKGTIGTIGTIGTAFIWEDKNSTLDLQEKDINQMRRYAVGSAGYAVWCNMRRILAIRFSPLDPSKFETIADIPVDQLFGTQTLMAPLRENYATSLALFKLLFSKSRFTRFSNVIAQISVDESKFVEQADPLKTDGAIASFINGSQEALSHLRLAALAQIREALAKQLKFREEEESLRTEWQTASTSLVSYLSLNQEKVQSAIGQLPWGTTTSQQMHEIEAVVAEAEGRASLRDAIRAAFDNWSQRALSINNAVRALHFRRDQDSSVLKAYEVWSDRQTDPDDVKPETYAEQVGYVFFVRLLLVRVLEDKGVIKPRMATDGGFIDWTNYVSSHFDEVNGISVLGDTFYDLLTRKAGYYYLHFFQQPIFDWFKPDDYLLVETLEFLSRFNFHDVSSDIIGFTYEQYIERNARNRKGHFLTRPTVVEYMLDILDYSGTQVIGRRILDPACGSGSFLVHAARRYRTAFVSSICQQNNLSDARELEANSGLRQELAKAYLDALTTQFYGLEINPFACYLAEMNLLIQALDDLFVLQQTGESYSIERFQIYNTDSLQLPREVLDNPDVTGTSAIQVVPDRLSERLLDEAFPIKARLDEYASRFFYIICNPPYVTSKREDFDVDWIKSTQFYTSILSGDTNLYLLFLRLGLHYLADRGQMVYIVPLTIIGDSSASAARNLFSTHQFTPAAAIRFYRGDVLFPGVDQAVAIIRINHSQANLDMVVSGGATVADAHAHHLTTSVAQVTQVVPKDLAWHGSWLVSNNAASMSIWNHAFAVSSKASTRLSSMLDKAFDMRQGDINATEVNFARQGAGRGRSPAYVALYKGEDIAEFAPLPLEPSDWAATATSATLTSRQRSVLSTLQALTTSSKIEKGIVRREVARLNTRERIRATWFERDAHAPIAFTHETWRMVLKSGVSDAHGKALLGLISSKPIVYLLNLFSTNNHVGRDELGRIPIPDAATFPEVALANLADAALKERANLQTTFVHQLGAQLPEFEDGSVYIPPSAVLAVTAVSKLLVSDLTARHAVRNTGSTTGRIETLRKGGRIICTLPETDPMAAPFNTILSLFFAEPSHSNDTWTTALSWQLPDPVIADTWLATYNDYVTKAQASWDNFVSVQRQIDNTVAKWYGFDATMRAAIQEGLPWARRRQPSAPSSPSIPEPSPASPPSIPLDLVNSSMLSAIGYEPDTLTLHVQFITGDLYQYEQVPAHIFDGLTSATSKGTYYTDHIKGKFPSSKL